MNDLLSGVELPPVKIEIEEAQLQRIAIYVIGIGVILFILKSIINNLFN
jgi:hypothetical protein